MRACEAKPYAVHSRLLLTLALFAASVLWLGATPTTLGASVVVFPLTVNGDAQKDSGNRLAVLIAQQMAENGVKVVAPTPGTQRKDFLDVARQLGCDYYVTGFITPLGQEVTVVEQVVSTISGTVVFSNSAQLLTYADANGQGALLAGAVLRHAGRGLASLGEAPANVSTPAPKESNEANLTGIFKRKPKAKAKASPSASPAAAAATLAQAAPPKPVPTTRARAPEPVRTAAPITPAPVPPNRSVPTPAPAGTVAAAGGARVVLFEFGGTAASDRRAFARAALESRLVKSGQSVKRAAALDPTEVVKRAADLCAQNGAKALVDAQLATRDGDQTYGPNTVALIDVRAVDCTGRVVFQQRFERDGTGRKNWERAIDSAAAAAVSPLDRAIR